MLPNIGPKFPIDPLKLIEPPKGFAVEGHPDDADGRLILRSFLNLFLSLEFHVVGFLSHGPLGLQI